VVAASRALLNARACWRLLEAGASDVFAWDHSGDPAVDIVARFRRWEAIDALARSSVVQETFVGQSQVWRRVVRHVVEVAHFTDASILITGESGTGKELAARLIHELDPRPDKGELVILDCTTVVPTLSGSEFFGHEKGAFTGAVAARDGAFGLADGGTLFLDEVGELPLGLQAELLRVIQEGMYKRVGSNAWRRTNFRLLCATNRDLLREESKGRFRKDLYYRIANWTCRLPSLSERTEDIPLLTRHFVKQFLPEANDITLDDTIAELLLQRDYPGNVRDLRQVVSRICSRHAGPGPITAGDVPPEERPSLEREARDWRHDGFEHGIRRALGQGVQLPQIGKAAAETAIQLALAEEDGNLQRAARRLGITDRALQMRIAARRGNGHDPSQ
jgi:transcriptional regulator with GAF, ATPase, and Fis domain